MSTSEKPDEFEQSIEAPRFEQPGDIRKMHPDSLESFSQRRGRELRYSREKASTIYVIDSHFVNELHESEGGQVIANSLKLWRVVDFVRNEWPELLPKRALISGCRVETYGDFEAIDEAASPKGNNLVGLLTEAFWYLQQDSRPKTLLKEDLMTIVSLWTPSSNEICVPLQPIGADEKTQIAGTKVYSLAELLSKYTKTYDIGMGGGPKIQNNLFYSDEESEAAPTTSGLPTLPQIDPNEVLTAFSTELAQEIGPKITRLQGMLDRIVGHEFGKSIERKREFAKSLNAVLKRLGACLISEAGEPAIMVVGGSAFQLEERKKVQRSQGEGKKRNRSNTSTGFPSVKIAVLPKGRKNK